MLHAGSLLGLLIDPEDGGIMFLQNGYRLQNYITIQKTLLFVDTTVITSNPKIFQFRI
jgi:hypothetical protein